MMIDFKIYSLVLIKENNVIFSSKESGLKPLVECITKTKNQKDCLLYDKVIGLAAAKLIVYSKIVSRVKTPLASIPAKEFLEKNKITLEAEDIIENILDKTKTRICPMEEKSKVLSPENLFLSLRLK
ncbi:MAG: DUF1893 domain-containing protein [Candidatus Nanoarchaeia archaeon]|nr:DUF1893 domain-containing protein [Candidatus Nanoarchaeia archaeon]